MPIRVLTAKFIHDIVQSYPNLESVDLSHNLIKRIENLSQLACLKALDLSHNEISVLEHVDCLPMLEHLDVSNNKISIIDRSIANCSQLEHLDLRHNLLLTAASLKPLSGLSELKSLMLEGNPICSIRDYRKQVARLLSNLETLDDRPIFVLDRVEQESDQIKEGCCFSKSSASSCDERPFSHGSASLHCSPSPLPSQHLSTRDVYRAISPELGDLMKQIQLRDLQIASFQKVMQIQEASAKDGADELLNRWRRKVYELLVQLESQALQNHQMEQQFRSEQAEYDAQLASMQKQLVVVKESADRQLLENELLSDRKKAAEIALISEQTRSRTLVNRLNIMKQVIHKSKSVIQQQMLPFKAMFDALFLASDELEGLSQRMKFALSRIKIYSEIIDKKKSSLHSPCDSLPSVTAPISSSRTLCLEREIEQLSQERALLLCKVADFERRILIAVDTASAVHAEQLKIVIGERDSALGLVEDVKKENECLQSKLNLKESETQDLEARLLAEREARASEQKSTTEIHFRLVSDVTKHFKETVDKLISSNQELLKECKDMKALHELEANRVRMLEDQLSRQRDHLDEKLKIQASFEQLLLEKSHHSLQAVESENRNLKTLLHQKDKEIERLLSEVKRLQQKDVQDAGQQTMIAETSPVKSGTGCDGYSMDAIRLHNLASLASSLL